MGFLPSPSTPPPWAGSASPGVQHHLCARIPSGTPCSSISPIPGPPATCHLCDSAPSSGCPQASGAGGWSFAPEPQQAPSPPQSVSGMAAGDFLHLGTVSWAAWARAFSATPRLQSRPRAPPPVTPLGGPQLPHIPGAPVTPPPSFTHLIPIAVHSLAGFQSSPNSPLPQGLCTRSSCCPTALCSPLHKPTGRPLLHLLQVGAECPLPSEALLAVSTSLSAGTCPQRCQRTRHLLCLLLLSLPPASPTQQGLRSAHCLITQPDSVRDHLQTCASPPCRDLLIVCG